MKRVQSFVSLLAMLAVIMSLNCAAFKSLTGKGGYVLQYRMDEGTRFSIIGSSTLESVTDQMGTEVVADINSKGQSDYTVLSSGEETGLTIELKYGERSQEMESPMGSASTDYSALVDKKVKFNLFPTGDVKDLVGFEDLPEITTVEGTTLNKELYELGAKGSFFRLPEQPVKIGDSWTENEDRDIPLGGNTLKSENTTTYTLIEEVEWEGHECVKIEVTGVQKLSGDFEQNGTPLSLERETKTEGTIYFAHKKGMYLSMEMHSDAEGIITVVGAGMEIPQTMTTKANVIVKFTK